MGIPIPRLTKSFDTQFYEQLHCLKKILYLTISLNNWLVATLGPKTTRVGWIGTGVMGGSMCQHLIDAGYQCTVVGAAFIPRLSFSLTVLLASATDSLLRELSWFQVLWKLLRILMSFSVLLGILCFLLLTIAILLMWDKLPLGRRDFWRDWRHIHICCVIDRKEESTWIWQQVSLLLLRNCMLLLRSRDALLLMLQVVYSEYKWYLVSGGDVGARTGKLSIMVGGDKTTYDDMLPLFGVESELESDP